MVPSQETVYVVVPSQETVYVVDDDEAVRDSLAALLETIGFNVRLFSQGLEFLSAIATSFRGCVLLDIQLPGLSGLEVVERLAENESKLSIVLMTAFATPEIVSRAERSNVVALVEKPLNQALLIENIERALRTSSQAP